MQAVSRITPTIFGSVQKSFMSAKSLFHSLINPNTPLANPGGLFSISVRTNIRNNFPKPSEYYRFKKLGWAKRMSTPGGRKILMRRILKGRFVYAH